MVVGQTSYRRGRFAHNIVTPDPARVASRGGVPQSQFIIIIRVCMAWWHVYKHYYLLCMRCVYGPKPPFRGYRVSRKAARRTLVRSRGRASKTIEIPHPRPTPNVLFVVLCVYLVSRNRMFRETKINSDLQTRPF